MSSACWLAYQRIRLRSPGKFRSLNFGSFFSRQSMKNEADRFFLGAAGRSGYAGDADSQRRAAAFANSFGERDGNFAR